MAHRLDACRVCPGYRIDELGLTELLPALRSRTLAVEFEELTMASIRIIRKAGATLQTVDATPRWWSMKGLADDWNVSQQTVRRLIKSGKLPAYRVGRRWRIRNTDAVNCISS